MVNFSHSLVHYSVKQAYQDPSEEVRSVLITTTIDNMTQNNKIRLQIYNVQFL